MRELAVWGNGWSARLVAAAWAASGYRVHLIAPILDPEALPRPFPHPDDGTWDAFLRRAFGELRGGKWRLYGGAINDAWQERTLANPEHTVAWSASSRGIRRIEPRSSWAWAEPADGYPELWERLQFRLDNLGVTCHPIAGVPRLSGGLWRPARLAGSRLRVRSWHFFFPAADESLWHSPVIPSWCPRFACGSRAWWTDRDNAVWWGDRLPAVGFDESRSSTNAPRQWGMASDWNVQVHEVPAPPRLAPADWGRWLIKAADRWYATPS